MQPKAWPNGTTVDLRRIKAELDGSRDRLNGRATLDKLAKDRPYEWLKLMFQLIAKEETGGETPELAGSIVHLAKALSDAHRRPRADGNGSEPPDAVAEPKFCH